MSNACHFLFTAAYVTVRMAREDSKTQMVTSRDYALDTSHCEHLKHLFIKRIVTSRP